MLELHKAIESRDIDEVDRLLKSGSSLSETNAEGMTPVLVACLYGFRDVAQILISAGADPLLKNSEGLDGMDLAVLNENLEILKLLLEVGVGITDRKKSFNILDLIMNHKGREIAELLLAKGAPLAGRPDIRQPVFWAIQEGNLEIVKFFIEHGVDINTVEIGHCENPSMLRNAAAAGHMDIVKYLVERGAEISILDSEGVTPAGIARAYEFDEIADYLEAQENCAS